MNEFEHQLRGSWAAKQSTAHQDQMVKTPTDRRSYDLRMKAIAMNQRGHREETFPLFQQAAALHPENADTPEALAARYDLAEAYKNRHDGHTLDNLLVAEGLYRSVYNSPVRRQDHARFAMTTHALATCLRRIAHVAGVKSESGRERLEEAKKLMVEAVKIAEQLGSFGGVDLIGYRLGLGNVYSDLGEADKALKVFRKAEHDAGRDRDVDWRGSKSEALGLLRLALAQQLVHQGRDSDLREAREKLELVCREASPVPVAQAHLMLAQLHLKEKKTGKQSAQKELRNVDIELLDPTQLLLWVELSRKAGIADRALLVLHQEIEKLIYEQVDSSAPRSADATSQRLQTLAWVTSGLYLGLGRDRDAFLVLENTAALRYSNVCVGQAYKPTNAFARAAEKNVAVAQWMANAFYQFGLALASNGSTSKEMAAPLRTFRTWIADQCRNDNDLVSMKEVILHGIEQLEAIGVPADEAMRLSVQLMEIIERVQAEVRSRDPAFAKLSALWDAPMGFSELEALSRIHDDTVFVRLAIWDEIRAIGVWWDGTTLCTESIRNRKKNISSILQTILSRNDGQPKTLTQADLSELDISPILRAANKKRLVILPNGIANYFPIAALGPSGCTPLDLVEGICWLPSLAPLRFPFIVDADRKGETCFVGPDTNLGQYANSDVDPAVIQKLNQTTWNTAAKESLVISVFAHTTNEDGDPRRFLYTGSQIQDDNNDNVDPEFSIGLRGMERVELWACESGLHASTELGGVTADEVYGLDGSCLLRGAQTTVGTLWPVSEYVTASIVRHYRRSLSEGIPPDIALARAQRWWRDEVAHTLTPEDSAVAQSPTAWAGYRFIGHPNAPVRHETLEPTQEPLSQQDVDFLPALITGAHAETDLDNGVEHDLRQTRKKQQETGLAPESALHIAKLYDARQRCQRTHNLVCALAYVYEALKNPEASTDFRRRAMLEAGYLWLDMALEGGPVPVLPQFLEKTTPVHKARSLLKRAGGPETEGGLALCALILDRPIHVSQNSLAISTPDIMDTDGTLKIDLRDRFGQRSLWAACIVAVCTPEWKAWSRTLLVACTNTAHPTKIDFADYPMWNRVLHGVRWLAEHYKIPFECPRETLDALRGWQHGVATFQTLRQVVADNDPPTPHEFKVVISEQMTQAETAVWGGRSSGAVGMLRRTGQPDPEYRQIVGSYLFGKTFQPNGVPESVDVLTCLDLSCDLRLGMLGALARFFGVEEKSSIVWFAARDREHLLDALVEHASAGELGASGNESDDEGHDPFFGDSDALLRVATGPQHWLSWAIAHLGTMLEFSDPIPPKTAAFHAVRAAERLTGMLDNMADKLRDLTKPETAYAPDVKDELRMMAETLITSLNPQIDLAANRLKLHKIPNEVCVLGVTNAFPYAIVFTAIWTGKHGKTDAVEVFKEDKLAHLHSTLLTIFKPHAEDLDENRNGTCPARGKAFRVLQHILAEPLQRVLGKAYSDGCRHLEILAPGVWRGIPWTGLLSAATTLFRHWKSISLLPNLTWSPLLVATDNKTPKIAFCGAFDTLHCKSPFGEVIRHIFIQSERNLHPLTPTGNVGLDIPEADQLVAIASDVTDVVFYGTGTGFEFKHMLGGLALDRGRTFSLFNFRGITFQTNATAWIWADARVPLSHGDTVGFGYDRFPVLTRGFFASGCGQVVDLAWPIHDLPKALVWEAVTWERTFGHRQSAMALLSAVRAVDSMLSKWKAACGETVEARVALEILDNLRSQHWQSVQVSLPDSAKFAKRQTCIDAMGTNVKAILEEVCEPSHLAAFRFWGRAVPWWPRDGESLM